MMKHPRNLDAVGILDDWALATGTFRRNRSPPGKRVLAAMACSAGLSYRRVAILLGDVSHVAVRDSYVALSERMARERRVRREVALDGSKAALGEEELHIWIARDVDSGEVLSFQGSLNPGLSDGAKFLNSVASKCQNKPLLRLGEGRNFPRGLANLDLYFQVSPPQSLLRRIGRIFRGTSLANLEDVGPMVG